MKPNRRAPRSRKCSATARPAPTLSEQTDDSQPLLTGVLKDTTGTFKRASDSAQAVGNHRQRADDGVDAIAREPRDDAVEGVILIGVHQQDLIVERLQALGELFHHG